MATAVLATKRCRSHCKRRIRWDRVFTSVLIPVVCVSIGRRIHASCTKDTVDAPSIITESVHVVAPSYSAELSGFREVPAKNTAVVRDTNRILVDDKIYGFRLALKASNSEMGIKGIYFSKKLGRIVSDREQKILMFLVLSEGAWEEYDAQVGIAATVLNRVLYEKQFPDSIEKVVTQPEQFSPVIMKNPETSYGKAYNGFYNQGGKVEVLWENYPKSVQESVHQAVYDALDGADPTECVGNALYYCNMSELSYEELEYRSNIGETITFGSTTFYREW